MDTNRVLEQHTVLIRGGRIVALAPSHQLSIPPNATRIDGRGKYLIPGLGDCHAHISLTAFRQNFSYSSTEAEDRLFLWLAAGVTTIRNMDYRDNGAFALDGKTLLQLRARAAAGELWSPRIYTSGQWAPLQYTGDYMPGDTAVGVRKPRLDSVAAYVAAYKAAGYDHIKTYVPMSRDFFDSLAAAARRVGMPIVGHAAVPLEQALQAYRSIEHMIGYLPFGSTRDVPPAHLRALAEATQRAGVWNCPTLAIGGGWAPNRFVKVLQDAGAGLLMGTDAPLVPILKFVPLELEAFVDAGLTPYQAMLTGTRNIAAYFGTLDETGTIAVGKRADLVLLNGNPLEAVGHVRNPYGVMIGGRWLNRDALNRRMATVAPHLFKAWGEP